jgi:PIN domain nuclease of toxin-antitoxin system
MIYVTDTHPLIFYAVGQTRKLGRKALRAFTLAERRQATIHIPTVCFFELALLLESGKVRSNLSFAEWKARVEEAGGFIVEPLTWDDIEDAQSLQAFVDPFDRLIAGTANRLRCPLITRDSRITGSRQVATVW